MAGTTIWRAAVALCLTMALSSSPAQTIRVTGRTHVPLELPGRPLGEPHLAVHPSKPEHLLGAVMVHDPSARLGDSTRARIRCATFVSTDDGATWKRQLFDLEACFDPGVAITPEGRAMFIALGRDARFPGSDDELVVHASPDGGLTWDSRPVLLGRGHDHPMLVVDRSSPDRANWAYVVSSLMARADHGILRFGLSVSRTRNGGRSFDPPVFLRPTTLMALAETPVVLSDGTLLLSYVEPAMGDGRTLLPRRRAWVMQSRDGGFDFARPTFINEACGASNVSFSLSSLAVDASPGPYRDRLYFACNQARPSEVVVSASADRGETWTAPAGIGGAVADSTVRRKVMASAVSAGGVLGVVWVETGRNPAGPCAGDVYFAASLDGGQSFLPAERVARASACPDRARNGQAGSGDYFGLATDALGRFRLLSSGVRDGLLQLELATIEVAGEPARR